jgi:opacity protein-like surface antigen
MSGWFGRRFVAAFVLVVAIGQFDIKAAQAADTAPPPPGLNSSFYGKEPDPTDKLGKKMRPTKKVRDTTCPNECKAERDALQTAVENWYQWQANDLQNQIDQENKKKKPDAGKLKTLETKKADAQQGAKNNTGASAKKDELAKDIEKAKAALELCEKNCGKKKPEPPKPGGGGVVGPTPAPVPATGPTPKPEDPPPPPPPPQEKSATLPDLSGYKYKLPELPKCFPSEAAREKWKNEAETVKNIIGKCIADFGTGKGSWDRTNFTKEVNDQLDAQLTQCKADLPTLDNLAGSVEILPNGNSKETPGQVDSVPICKGGGGTKSGPPKKRGKRATSATGISYIRTSSTVPSTPSIDTTVSLLLGGGKNDSSVEDANPNGGGIVGGVSFGARFPIGNASPLGGMWFVGGEASLFGTGMSGTDKGIRTNVPALGLIQALIGIGGIPTGIGGPVTLYVGGGLATGDVKVTAGGSSDSKVMTGFSVGGGVDVQTSPNVTVGVQVQHFDLGSTTMFSGTAPVTERGTLFLGRATMHFGGMP